MASIFEYELACLRKHVAKMSLDDLIHHGWTYTTFLARLKTLGNLDGGVVVDFNSITKFELLLEAVNVELAQRGYGNVSFF